MKCSFALFQNETVYIFEDVSKNGTYEVRVSHSVCSHLHRNNVLFLTQSK